MGIVIAGLVFFIILMAVGILVRSSRSSVTTGAPHRRAADVTEDALSAEDAIQREEELGEAASRIRSILDQLDDLVNHAADSHDSAATVLSGAQERIRAADTATNMESIRTMLLSEVEHIIENNRELTRELRASRKIMREQHDRLDTFRIAARVDPLTGVGNRGAFDESLKQLTAKAEKSGVPLSLLMIDIDHFKLINDEHGHQVGDRALAGVARLLKSRVRGRDIVTRYGGEEFAIFLCDTPMQNALNVAEDIRSRAESTRITIDTLRLNLTLSIGVSQFVPGMKPSALVRFADEALYRAKHEGRNRIKSHFPE